MKRQILGAVPRNAIVRYQGSWGVVCGSPREGRVIDFWDGGREVIPAYEIVEVLA